MCEGEFTDYATNRRKKKHGVLFCSPACRAQWVGIHNSISRGGTGAIDKPRTAKLYYRTPGIATRVKNRANQRYSEKRTEILAKLREAGRQLKHEVIDAYGGRCACCGESAIEFMTIDHTDGGGSDHRKKTGKGRGIYKDLKARGFPKDGFQVLCFNCNIALGFYGYCPHRPDARRCTANHAARKAGRPAIVVAPCASPS